MYRKLVSSMIVALGTLLLSSSLVMAPVVRVTGGVRVQYESIASASEACGPQKSTDQIPTMNKRHRGKGHGHSRKGHGHHSHHSHVTARAVVKSAPAPSTAAPAPSTAAPAPASK